MGQIVEYNAPMGDIPRPSDTALSTAREIATAQNRFAREEGDALGGAISRVGGQVGAAIDNHLASRAIGHGAAVYSQMYGDLTQQWNQVAAKADPNDTSVQAGFNEKVLEPSLQKFMAAFDGQPQRAQEWAQRQADEMRQHFYVKTTADMSTRAEMAARQNVQDIARNFANVAASDPSTLDHINDTVRDSLNSLVDSSPNLSAEAGARVKTELYQSITKDVARAAALGVAQRDPDQLIKEIGSGRFDQWLDASEKNRALEAAQRFKEQKWIADNHDYELQKRQQEDTAKAAQDSYITDILAGKTLNAHQLALDQRLNAFPGERENVFNFAEEHARQLREKVDNTPHPVEFRRLLSQAYIVARDNPGAIDTAIQAGRDSFLAGSLNPRELAEFEQRVSGLDKPYEHAFTAQIQHVERVLLQTPQMTAKLAMDPGAAASTLNQIEADARTTLEDYRRQGKDVTPLLTPGNPQYLFQPQKINAYIAPSRGDMQAKADAIRAGTAKAAPAEALEMLRAHPETANAFKAQFGYLPDWLNQGAVR